jgi:hypothetical protein
MAISGDIIGTLARVAGIEVEDASAPALAQALDAHLSAFAAIEALDLAETDAAVTFDPRWDA